MIRIKTDIEIIPAVRHSKFHLKQKFESIPFVAHMHLKCAKSANMTQEGQHGPKGQKKEKREKKLHTWESWMISL
jgi:hypothetical protein